MKRLFALAVLGTAIFSVCKLGVAQEAKKSTTVTPLERKDKGSVDRHEKFLAIAKKGDVDVLFLGDSITQGWGNNAAWKKYFEPLKAANFGIGGDRTEHVLWRITEGKELEGIKPKVAVLMIGTNNVGGSSAEDIAAGVKAIVEQLHKAQPQMKVLLLGVFPRSGKKPSDPTKVAPAEQQPKIKAINDIIAKLDDGKTVVYMDIGGKFLDKDGNLPKEIMPDFLHLSAKGYDIWAEAIEGKVKELLK
jgi:lysophospholipase L1-like esterase